VNVCIFNAETCHITNGNINKQKMPACNQTTIIAEDDTGNDAYKSVEMRPSYTVSNNVYIRFLVYYNKTHVNDILKHHLKISIHICSNLPLILAVIHVYVCGNFRNKQTCYVAISHNSDAEDWDLQDVKFCPWVNTYDVSTDSSALTVRVKQFNTLLGL